jgi:hypothetical protein
MIFELISLHDNRGMITLTESVRRADEASTEC